MRASRAILYLSFTIAAACGKEHALVDAGSFDANHTDANTGPDADPHGIVTVTVLDSQGTGAPQKDVPVVFREPNGDLAAEVKTDVNGKASASVLAGASVTAVYPAIGTQHPLETILDVKPGDDLTIGAAHDTTAAGTFTVNVLDIAGTGSYSVYGPCGGNTVNVPSAFRSPLAAASTRAVPIPMQAYCKPSSTMDLVLIRNNIDFVATDYAVIKNVTFADAGSVDQVDAWQPLVQMTASYTNQPADVTNMQLEEDVPDLNGFPQAAGGGAGPTQTITFAEPLAPRALMHSTFAGTHDGNQDVYQTVDGTKSTYAMDIGATLLPWIDRPTVDLATGVITPVTSGSGGPGDAFRVQLQYQRPDPNGGSGAPPLTYVWTVWAATVQTITLPALPTDVMDRAPLATDTATNIDGWLFDLDAASGYDQVRAHLDSGLDAYLASRGALGTLKISTSVNNVGFTKWLALPRRRSLR
jgi:hypothetical protein